VTGKTQTIAGEAQLALQWLRTHSNRATLDGMARYAIPSHNALGVPMREIKALGQKLGRNQDLAIALWNSGIYEARMLASFVGDPEHLTRAQMDLWCRDFDNWAICDAMCFNLFDRSQHAWDKVAKWSGARGEFQKRAAFALLWSLTVHDKRAADASFIEGLARVELHSTDERHFVKKAVNMALRAIGKRNPALHKAALATSHLLADSEDPTARWIGKDALRELSTRKR
jgi:3-methyladenine DNA glycosylase AlkD